MPRKIKREVVFHNKRLAVTWKHDYFGPKSKKILDGVFLYDNIFSVYAFSTSKIMSVQRDFAHKTCEKINTLISEYRVYLKEMEDELYTLTTGIELRPFTPNNHYPIDYNKEQLNPVNSALIKAFAMANSHIINLNKARFDGDIDAGENERRRGGVIKQLNLLLNALYKICRQYHKIRKEQLATVA
ncbi:hypothetical protein [Candidatus Sororendozoicomonas aggregata]|uniref:hypothetical protein n=1 Tax=Candidatus Sororendozoicomonas aggregata TaxID=3073239 RepID=UPI002ED590E2